MKKIPVLVTVAVLSTVFLVFCDQPTKKDKVASTNTSISPDSLVKRGAYLVSIMGCNDCHTPKKMGPQWAGV